MATAKDCHILTSYYVKKFKDAHHREPHVNRYSARWGFDSVLMGMGIEPAKELLDYYFTTPADRDHDLEWFFYNYDKLYRAMQDTKADVERTERLAAESKKRVQEWRASGKRGITSD